MCHCIWRMFLFLLVISALSSCASISMVDSWKNPEVQAQRLQKLLVVRVAKGTENRRIFEDVLVAELRQKGINAYAGHEYITGSGSDRNKLETAVNHSGADGVITIQTVNLERQSQLEPGFATTYPDSWGPGWGPSVFSSWDLYGYYGSTTYYQPPSVSNFTVATIQVNVFNAPGGKLVWAATTETTEPQNTLSVSKDLAKLIVKSLVKDGII